MHSNNHSIRYQPSSPLSPRTIPIQGSRSPQSARHRSSQAQQSPRALRLDLPNLPNLSVRGQGMSPPTTVHNPTITFNRATQPTSMESPRLMREKQKELIARAQLTSKLAASPMSIRPEAPRLDPLGSPKGAMTPFTLEEQEAADYFMVAGVGRLSPAASPGARSSRSSTASAHEDKVKKHKNQLFR